MKTFKVFNWKKNRNETIFNVLTKCGKNLKLHDYRDSISIRINDSDELLIEVLEFSEDYQFGVPDDEKIKGKKSENEVDKYVIVGNEYNINNLLFSIGWSNTDNFHCYKNPLTESLIDELSFIKTQIESEIEDYKQLKEKI